MRNIRLADICRLSVMAIFLAGCSDRHISAIHTFPEQATLRLEQGYVPCHVVTYKVMPVERIYSDGSVKRSTTETVVGYNRC